MTPEVIKDTDADFANAAHTPALQNWITTWNKGKMIEPPDKKIDRQSKDDWGLHDPRHMGFPVHDEDSVKRAKRPSRLPNQRQLRLQPPPRSLRRWRSRHSR